MARWSPALTSACAVLCRAASAGSVARCRSWEARTAAADLLGSPSSMDREPCPHQRWPSAPTSAAFNSPPRRGGGGGTGGGGSGRGAERAGRAGLSHRRRRRPLRSPRPADKGPRRPSAEAGGRGLSRPGRGERGPPAAACLRQRGGPKRVSL